MTTQTALEAMEAEVKTACYGLSKEQLVRVTEHLHIQEGAAEKERHGLIKHINRYLDGEEIESFEDGGLKVMQDLREFMDGFQNLSSTINNVQSAQTTT